LSEYLEGRTLPGHLYKAFNINLLRGVPSSVVRLLFSYPSGIRTIDNIWSAVVPWTFEGRTASPALKVQGELVRRMVGSRHSISIGHL
jgi:hypothetical protein